MKKSPNFSPARVCRVFPAAALQTEGGQGQGHSLRDIPVLGVPGDNPEPNTEPLSGLSLCPSPLPSALGMVFGAFPFQCQQDLIRALPNFRGRGAGFSRVGFVLLLSCSAAPSPVLLPGKSC